MKTILFEGDIVFENRETYSRGSAPCDKIFTADKIYFTYDDAPISVELPKIDDDLGGLSSYGELSDDEMSKPIFDKYPVYIYQSYVDEELNIKLDILTNEELTGTVHVTIEGDDEKGKSLSVKEALKIRYPDATGNTIKEILRSAYGCEGRTIAEIIKNGGQIQPRSDGGGR